MSLHVTHYVLGDRYDAACGVRAIWQRGLAWTRVPSRTTCRRCLASPWLRVAASTRRVVEAARNVTPKENR